MKHNTKTAISSAVQKNMITLAVFVFALLIAAAANSPAYAADTISYIERSWDGSKVVSAEKTASCTPLSTCGEELGDGWYYVDSDKTYEDRISVDGTVNLILTDGKTLTCNDGINVGPGRNLNIYEQAGGTGKLTARGDTNNCAAIGGKNGQNCGNVTIHGGNVTADCYNDNKGEDGAGIGGGDSGTGGHIIIYGGNIEARGSNNGAGIGGGTRGSGGTIDIYGGIVKAKGGTDSAGIGGGDVGSGGTVNIFGGKIDAKGADNAAGIGGGDGGNFDTISISGGELVAKGGRYGAGIGSGNMNSISVGGTINISGNAVVESTGGLDAAGIGGGEDCTGGNITISGGTIKATGGSNVFVHPVTGGAGIGGGDGASSGNITITGGTVSEAKGGTHSAGIGGGDGGLWDKIIISGGIVNASGGEYGAGIGGGDKNTSTESSGEILITGGTVTANGGGDGAGIGGGEWTTGGNINITGGSINATGGTKDRSTIFDRNSGGAGIGGGDGGAGGNITISGGTVIVRSGARAAGIGSGADGDGNPTNVTLKYSDASRDISIYPECFVFGGLENNTVTVKLENDFMNKEKGTVFSTGEYKGKDVFALEYMTLVASTKVSETDDELNNVNKNDAVITFNTKTVNTKTVKAAAAKSGENIKDVKTIVLGKKVKKIGKGAFKSYRSAGTLVVKTGKLKKTTVKKALSGSKITKVKVKVGNRRTNKKYVRIYKNIFTKKNVGRKVKVSL